MLVRLNILKLAVVASIAVLTACSGGGSRTTPTTPGTSLGGTLQNGSVKLSFTIPGTSASSSARTPQFVSRSILSAVGTVFQQAGCPGACAGPYTTQAGQVVIDLSPTSPNCTTNPNGSRSCTVFLPAPTGSDVFELDTYDVAASSLHSSTSTARAPANPTPVAHELSSATSGPVTVSPGTSTAVNFALQGIIAGFVVPGSTPYQNGLSVARKTNANARAPLAAVCSGRTLPCVAYVQSAVGGVASSVVISSITPGISADDGALNPITGATAGCPAQDQFANPIAISVTEPASGGTTQFQIGPCNGAFGALGTTGTLSFPLDQLKVAYNGGGVAGDGTANAPYVGAVDGKPPSFGPAPFTNITTNPGFIEFIVAPLFAYVVNPNSVANSSAGGAQTVAVFNGPSSGNATISAVQYMPPSQGFAGYTATPNASCSGTDGNGKPQVVVTVQDAGAITYGHSWTLVPGNLPSAETCQIALSDGTSSVNVNVCNSVAGGGSTIVIQRTTCVPPPPPIQNTFVYVANDNDSPGTVSGYTLNTTTGALTEVAGSPFAVPGSIEVPAVAVDPAGKFLYASNASGPIGTIYAYTINKANGALTSVPGSPFAAGDITGAGTVDPTGKFLYVTNYQSSNISAYTINAGTGALTPVAGSPFTTVAGGNPTGVTVDPTGKFAYAANDSGGNVSAYTINAATGALTPVVGSPFAAGNQTYAVTVDPTGKFLYAANRGTSNGNVSAYTINAITGALTPVVGSPFAADAGPSSVAIDPTGKFAYAPNQNGNFTNGGDLSAYAINTATGALTAVAGSPFATGTVPEGSAFDPTGKFLYVTNYGGNTISIYSLNAANGVLTPAASSPFSAGNGPYGIAITKPQ
jgi:6-phosphogluconolactonase (cycloisomerase 2 family)